MANNKAEIEELGTEIEKLEQKLEKAELQNEALDKQVETLQDMLEGVKKGTIGVLDAGTLSLNECLFIHNCINLFVDQTGIDIDTDDKECAETAREKLKKEIHKNESNDS